jgi:signal transduction histidine kinase
MRVLLGDAGLGIVDDGSLQIRTNGLAGRGIATAAALLAAAVSAFQLSSPIHLNDPGARAGIETAIALSALLSAVLMLGHFKQDRRRRDLLLLGALLTVSLTEFACSAVPALIGTETVEFGIGARLGCVVLVSIAFTCAALAPDERLVGGGRRLAAFAALAGCGVAGLFGLGDLITGGFATSHAAISTSVGLAAGGLLLVAGAAFLSRAEGEDGSAGLMAGVCFLFAGAGLSYLVLPTVPTGSVTPGDGLRLAAYALLLVVAVRKQRQMSDHVARAAIRAERQRLARDLHDGLAQDLAVIAIHAQRFDAEIGPEHPLTIAAGRALAVARGAIVDLSASGALTTRAALRHVADELAARFGVAVTVHVEATEAGVASDDLNRSDREHVVRIVREAIVNAIRHGHARHIEITFDCREGDLLLRVSDDGRGIAHPTPRLASGFGMAAMRARAQSLGGRLTTRQRRAGGTELEVLVATAHDPRHDRSTVLGRGAEHLADVDIELVERQFGLLSAAAS